MWDFRIENRDTNAQDFHQDVENEVLNLLAMLA
jgi:hypothetical protein